MSLIDQPGTVREREALDESVVDAFMREKLDDLDGTLEIRQFPGGASNLTYELRYRDRAFVLRRPPFGTKARGAHDMMREARLLRRLRPSFPYVPEIVAICEDRSVLGEPFYVMERLEGVILRRNIPDALGLDEKATRRLCRTMVDRLVDLHSIDYAEAGLGYLDKGDGYAERQIVGWSKRYRKAQTPDVPDYVDVINWLHAHTPSDIRHCVIHNDYRFDNFVLDPKNPFEIIGVLDWELATVGDPLLDLGNTLAYWVEADDEPQLQTLRRQPSNAPGMMTRREIVAYYVDKTGIDCTSFDFYRIYGVFRVAVILQQIYYRYFHGQTQDRRFADFGSIVSYLESHCLRLIDGEDW